jgi:hypothetical protein
MVKSWKTVERGIGSHLTQILSDIGNDTVIQRIPLLGREGPDLTFPNPFRMVFDVKSRDSVPRSIFKIVNQYTPGTRVILECYEGDFITRTLFACQLGGLHVALLDPPLLRTVRHEYRYWLSIVPWVDHMRAWTNTEHGSIGAVVLHRARIPYGKTVVVFDIEDYTIAYRERLDLRSKT